MGSIIEARLMQQFISSCFYFFPRQPFHDYWSFNKILQNGQVREEIEILKYHPNLFTQMAATGMNIQPAASACVAATG